MNFYNNISSNKKTYNIEQIIFSIILVIILSYIYYYYLDINKFNRCILCVIFGKIV